MVRISNAVVSIFSFVTLVISVVAIGASVWFYINPGTVCQKVFLQQPLLITGLVVLAVSLFGLAGSCCHVSWILRLYLIAMFLVIVGLVGLTVFGIVVTNKGVGQVISGRGFKEYRLGDFSNWLQNHVVNDKNWDKIKSCMVDAKVCNALAAKGRIGVTAADFYKTTLSATESGCCKPPTPCGFEYQNATTWAVPKSGPAVSDSDCKAWSNNQKTLCFDCKSCKAGFLVNIKKEWRPLAIGGACILVILVIVYCIGCCALKNNQEDSYKCRRYKGYP